MIGKLTGRWGGMAGEGAALVEVGGVGYAVRLPLFALEELRRSAGTTVSLFIHTAVREDAIDLYGFATEGDLGLFRQLMSVSGIGPKTALGIMNAAESSALRRAIARGQAQELVKVFGIGKKSAERIVVELRDKITLEAGAGATSGMGADDSEVVEALMALGYGAQECREALAAIGEEITETRLRVSAALKYLGGSVQKI